MSPPPSNRRPRLRKVETATFRSPVATSVEGDNGLARVEKRSEVAAEERDWVDGDVEILKKQLLKHPVGMPGRWEAVAEAFQGRHGVESVIRKAKSLGEKKLSDSDSFNRFLKDRKPVDKRVEDAMAMENGEKKEGWSSGEDIALLNALKAFPKDVPMRWEKIAAAVPGRSKAACMKRFSELKKDFRNPKLLLRSNCVEEVIVLIYRMNINVCFLLFQLFIMICLSTQTEILVVISPTILCYLSSFYFEIRKILYC
ncbi:unnamed protein product, partial [Vitis vinifera]|uniref:Myb-like domain-containing protein n=1 Tax=Vitis vinifera TaxID=29760 RepID=D7TXL0_VITVI